MNLFTIPPVVIGSSMGDNSIKGQWGTGSPPQAPWNDGKCKVIWRFPWAFSAAFWPNVSAWSLVNLRLLPPAFFMSQVKLKKQIENQLHSGPMCPWRLAEYLCVEGLERGLDLPRKEEIRIEYLPFIFPFLQGSVPSFPFSSWSWETSQLTMPLHGNFIVQGNFLWFQVSDYFPGLKDLGGTMPNLMLLQWGDRDPDIRSDSKCRIRNHGPCGPIEGYRKIPEVCIFLKLQGGPPKVNQVSQFSN